MALPLIPIIVTAVTTALASGAAKLFVRGFAALGFGAVTYVGFGALMTKFKNEVISGWGQLPEALVALLDIGGFTQGIEILFASYVVYIGLVVLSRFEFLGGKK